MKRAIDTLLDQREAFAARPEEARGWELDAIAGRERLLDHVTALAQPPG